MKQMNSEPEVQSLGLMSAEKANKDDSNLSEHTPVKDTPFTIRKFPDTGYFATLGKYRITDEEPTKEIIEKQIADKGWHLICAVISVCVTDLIAKQSIDQ